MTDRVIFRERSAFNEIILTEEVDGLLTLRFSEDGACQSVVRPNDPGHLELEYTRVLPAALALADRFERVLIVGLGAGAIPRFLQSYFPDSTIHVVEVDERVVHVATELCGLRRGPGLQIFVEDARDYIVGTDEKYDVVLLDGFGDDSVPEHLRTVEFLTEARACLKPGGVVIGNVWGRNHSDHYDRALATYRAAFSDLYIFDVPISGTKLFAGLDRPVDLSRDDVVSRLEARFAGRGEQADLVEAFKGFRNARDEKGSRAVPFRDS